MSDFLISIAPNFATFTLLSLLYSLILFIVMQYKDIKILPSILLKLVIVSPLIAVLPWQLLPREALMTNIQLGSLFTGLGTIGAAIHPTANLEQSLAQLDQASSIASLMVLSILSISMVNLFITFYGITTLNKRIGMTKLPDQQRRQLLQQTQGKSKTINIFVSDTLHSPFIYGFIRKRLVLPKDFYDIPDAYRSWIIKHEGMHAQTGDLFWFNTSQLLIDIFWFLPHLRWLKSRLIEALEVECDKNVLKDTPQAYKEYGQALLFTLKHYSVTKPTPYISFGNLHGNVMKERIIRIKNNHQQGGFTMKYTSLFISIVLSAGTAHAAINSEWYLPIKERFLETHKASKLAIDEREAKAFQADASWSRPLDEIKISSKFKIKQKIRNHRSHLGIDLIGKLGTPVKAANTGTIIIADNSSLNKNYGNVIVIDHGNNQLSLYSHLNDFKVKAGDTVSSGEVIGSIGITGKTTGPHLHFELVVDGRHVDPIAIMKTNDEN